MTKLELISYEESRLAFFEQQLAGANRKLDWAIKHKSHWDCAEMGEIVSYYQDIVEMLREQAERSGCEVCNSLVAMRYETVCDWSDDGKAVWDINTMHFCPNCGAKMESEGGT